MSAKSHGITSRRPPDAIMISPVNHADSSDARNTAIGAMSDGCPMRPRGVMATSCCSNSLLAGPEVPVELAAVVGKMMAKEPERRFQEPKQVAQALLPFFKKGSSGSVRPKPDVSQAGQTNARWSVSTPTQAATDAGRSAAPDEEMATPSAKQSKRPGTSS